MTDPFNGMGNPDMLETGEPAQPTGLQQPAYGDTPGAGDFLTLAPAVAAQKLIQAWKDQDSLHKLRRERWKVNKWQRMGMSGARLIKTENRDEWRAYLPPGARANVPGINKADDICAKLVANLTVDPPAPDAQPGDGGEDDREAAILATRILVDLQSESCLNQIWLDCSAWDQASIYGSGFQVFYIDPQGGGRVPVTIQAHPLAPHAAAPFTGAPQPVTDGMGQPVPGPDGQPLMGPGPELPPPYTRRHVMPDGTLTDDPQQAAQQWAPRLKAEVLTGKHVRLVPAVAQDIWEAHGVLIGSFVARGTLRRMFPEALAALTPAQEAGLTSWRPDKSEDLLPAGRKKDQVTGQEDKDNDLVWVVRGIYSQCGDYPTGCYIIAAGDGVLLDRRPWTDDQGRVLDLPVTQYRSPDRQGLDDPYGTAMMSIIGDTNEIRVASVATLLANLDRINSQKTFVPTSSIAQSKDLLAPARKLIPINPGGAPVNEVIPEFPQAAMTMYEISGQEMDSTSGLQEAAQGVQSANVHSGRQAQQVVAQALTNLSGYQHAYERGYIRACRIQLQMVRAFYTTPQKLKWAGEDGGYRMKEWEAADLESITDVAIKPGTLTMLSPQTKANMALDWGQRQILAPPELRDILESHIGPEVGLQDDPARQRVRRQLSAWREGPPDGWQPAVPQMVMGPAGPQQVPTPDPVLDAIWTPVPADELPTIALLRTMELSKAINSARFQSFPPGWTQPLAQAFESARQAAGVQTIAEQQQAAAMQQQQQMQMAQAQREKNPPPPGKTPNVDPGTQAPPGIQQAIEQGQEQAIQHG